MLTQKTPHDDDDHHPSLIQLISGCLNVFYSRNKNYENLTIKYNFVSVVDTWCVGWPSDPDQKVPSTCFVMDNHLFPEGARCTIKIPV